MKRFDFWDKYGRQRIIPRELFDQEFYGFLIISSKSRLTAAVRFYVINTSYIHNLSDIFNLNSLAPYFVALQW